MRQTNRLGGTAIASLNRVCLVGNLTRDVETRQAGDTTIASLRLAVNDRRKVDGEWVEAPNYFDVDVFGKQAESCAQFLSRGRQVAVDGRLRWREWETPEGQKRQAVSIVADSVQFIGPRESSGEQGGQESKPAADTFDKF